MYQSLSEVEIIQKIAEEKDYYFSEPLTATLIQLTRNWLEQYPGSDLYHQLNHYKKYVYAELSGMETEIHHKILDDFLNSMCSGRFLHYIKYTNDVNFTWFPVKNVFYYLSDEIAESAEEIIRYCSVSTFIADDFTKLNEMKEKLTIHHLQVSKYKILLEQILLANFPKGYYINAEAVGAIKNKLPTALINSLGYTALYNIIKLVHKEVDIKSILSLMKFGDIEIKEEDLMLIRNACAHAKWIDIPE